MIMVLILCCICSSCLFLGTIMPRKYVNAFSGGCYLETENAIYLLFCITKIKNKYWTGLFIPPQFSVYYEKNMLIMITIINNGNIYLQRYFMNTPLFGFYVASGAHLLKTDNGILLLDYGSSYLINDNIIAPFFLTNNIQLTEVIKEFQTTGKTNSLLKWNRQNNCHHGKIRTLYMPPCEQLINCNNHVITLTRNKKDGKSDIVCISSQDFLHDSICVVIPSDEKISYFTQDFNELPYIIVGKRLYRFSKDYGSSTKIMDSNGDSDNDVLQ